MNVHLHRLVQYTTQIPESKVLLILDGPYSNNRNIDKTDMSREKDIVSLPPHTTYKMQPSDKIFIEPLKT